MATPVPVTRSLRVLFAVTEDWYFWSHRRRLAARLKALGCEVLLATRFSSYETALRTEGIACIALPFARSLRHPLRDIRTLMRLWLHIRRVQPDIVHLVSLKPILLGGLTAFAVPTVNYVAAVTGMGYLFSSSDKRARPLKRVVATLLRRILRGRNTWVIVQNEDDRALLAAHGIGCAERTELIPGVGVDLDEFAYAAPDTAPAPLVMLPARLIRDKGIEEFVAAAALVRRSNPAVRFALVGGLDPDNPASYSEAMIRHWVARGDVEWWGHRADMPAVYRAARIVCLPSYREGLPKALIEACAVGRPIIASDVSGCRDVCRDGVNGVLVPVRDARALAAAVERLLAAPDIALRYGLAGRQMVEQEYSVAGIAAHTLAFYRRVCAGAVMS